MNPPRWNYSGCDVLAYEKKGQNLVYMHLGHREPSHSHIGSHSYSTMASTMLRAACCGILVLLASTCGPSTCLPQADPHPLASDRQLVTTTTTTAAPPTFPTITGQYVAATGVLEAGITALNAFSKAGDTLEKIGVNHHLQI